MSKVTSQKGIDLIKEFEGCRLSAYLCPAGKPTIGYGHTEGVNLGQTITQAQAEEYLKLDLAKYENAVNKLGLAFTPNQNQFDALVSFAYNNGIYRGGLEDFRGYNEATIRRELPLYKNAYVNGVKTPLAGLIRRREAELNLFNTKLNDSVSQSTPDKNTCHLVVAGDTCWGIAQKYGVSVEQICKYNPVIGDGSLIKPGQILTVKLAASTSAINKTNEVFHLVVPGDTCWDIAQKHKVSIDQICKYNPVIGDGSLIKPGQILRIK